MLFKSPIKKEWNRLIKEEQKYLKSNVDKKNNKINELLEEKVPNKLQTTLDNAFMKAFTIVFEKGNIVIEKTYSKDDLKKEYLINEYISKIKKNRKNLRRFSKSAKSSSTKNIVLSSVSGISFGALGIGIPDIVVFIGILLKSIYEIALRYGFDYQDNNEKLFILKIIEGALSNDEELIKVNNELNCFIENELYEINEDIEICIQKTSKSLSSELLYMKFLQGIPILGIVGGISDMVYTKKILKYAELKYRRRFYYKRICND